MKKLIIILSVASLLAMASCKTKPVCRSVSEEPAQTEEPALIN